MHFKKRIAAIAVAALAFGGVATVAASSASASATYSATTILVNRPDSGNNTDNGGVWALDSLTRTSVLTDNGVDSDDSSLEDFTLVITDTGSFTTQAAASNPNGERPSDLIANQPITGTVNGSDTFTFTAPVTAMPNSGGVPPALNGSTDSTSNWPYLFFASETDLTNIVQNPWGWSYYSPETCESWADTSANGSGDGYADGGISGYGHCAVTVTDPGAQRTHVGDAVSLQIVASTASSDKALTFTMSGQPAGLSINPSTGLITGTPTAVENTDIVKVTATDAYGSHADTYFSWVTTNAQVPDTLTESYVCGYGHPRAQFRVTIVTGSYRAHVNLTEVRWGGAVVGNGNVFVNPGHPIIVNANNSVASRVYYERNGSQPPVGNAGAIFLFARIPVGHARSC
jgi:hypothetical protein